MRERVIAFLAGVVAAFLLVAAGWLLLRISQSGGPSESLEASPTPMLVATPTPVPPHPEREASPPAGFRLAGVAENAGELFAVVESPRGEHALYRRGEDVPGLGELVSIGDERATFRTDAGLVTLWVVPAPTATRTVTPRLPTATPVRRPEYSSQAAER